MMNVDTYGAMTVGDLLRELGKFPENMKVFMFENSQYRDIVLDVDSLRMRKVENPPLRVNESRGNIVRTYVNDFHVYPEDGKPEECLCIRPRSGLH